MHWLGTWDNAYARYITDLAVDYHGCLWATTELNYVLKFTSTLEPLGEYGQEGIGLNDLKDPLSITDGGGHAGWYNMLITERWTDDSGIRYYVPSPDITDLFTQSSPQGNNCEVIITFNLTEYSNLKIEIYNLQNFLVRNLLFPGQTAQAGVQLYTWDGKDGAGINVPQGDYRVKVTSTGLGTDETGNPLTAIAQDTVTVCDQLPCTWLVGDADGTGNYTISDIVRIQDFLFAGGDPPTPHSVGSGDANCSGSVSISDVVYLINFIFASGPSPGNPDGTPPEDCLCSDYQ